MAKFNFIWSSPNRIELDHNKKTLIIRFDGNQMEAELTDDEINQAQKIFSKLKNSSSSTN